MDAAEIPIGLSAAEYLPEKDGAIVYGRSPLFLAALEERMGRDVHLALWPGSYRMSRGTHAQNRLASRRSALFGAGSAHLVREEGQ